MKRILLLLTVALFTAQSWGAEKPKYIFYFIGDGMGHNQIALTEAWLASQAGDSAGFVPLNFTQFPACGFATSHCATRRVTDSAAAGTALATGEKTSVGTIGMNTGWTEPIYSVAIEAKKQGMGSGAITSVSIDHATPASFYAHQKDRGMAYEIGLDASAAGLDLYGGAGFVRNQPEGQVSVYETLQKNGYTVTRGDQKLKGKKAVIVEQESAPVDALTLAIDATEQSLTLPKMTQRSIDFLVETHKKDGFFLMVEGGQIDWMGHNNDAASLVHETLDFAQAIDVALQFMKQYPDQTLIVVTADHETGGIALGRNDRGYDTNFERLSAQKCSGNVLSNLMKGTDSWAAGKKVLQEQMGFGTLVPLKDKEWEALEKAYGKKPSDASSLAIRILAQYAGVGWTTGSHTAAYVPVFAIGAGSEYFNGRLDNTHIPRIIGRLMQKN